MTLNFSVAKLTLAFAIPGNFAVAFSIVWAQEAQLIPS
ncbi:hypothetical protein J810_4137, partial [Acinetobacter sp. 25977_7]